MLARIVELHDAAIGTNDDTLDALVSQAVELETLAIATPAATPSAGLALLRLARDMLEAEAGSSGYHHDRVIHAALRQAEAVLAPLVELPH
jgi:hypothetical protein